MKKDLTELVFILDRSGSMAGLESDTIGGFNSFIEKQKDVDGECLVSTVLFNQASTVIHDRVSLGKIEKMTRKDYLASGTTALIDALGDAIKALVPLRRDGDLDQGGDGLVDGVVPVDDGLVAQDHMVPLQLRDLGGDLRLGHVAQRRKLGVGQGAVLFDLFEQPQFVLLIPHKKPPERYVLKFVSLYTLSRKKDRRKFTKFPQFCRFSVVLLHIFRRSGQTAGETE